MIRLLEGILATAITLAAVAWSLGIAQILGWAVYTEQFAALMLAATLALAYLHLPAVRGEPRTAVPWYDALAAIASSAAAAYIAVRYPNLVDLILLRPLDVVIAGGVVIVLLLEALRRATGKALPIIIAFFIGYALVADRVPLGLEGRAIEWRQLIGYLTIDINGMLGLPIKIGTTIVVMFILFGSLLGTTGGSRFFTELALLGMGRFRGGSAKIAVVASGLFGSISGSAVANVAATGVVTIPMIKKAGYKPYQAGAIEAVASTGGQLMPPVMGAAAFLMAEFLQVPYTEVVLAALVPALLYYAALFIQADLEAARVGIQRVDPADVPRWREVLPGMHFVVPFAVLIVLLFSYNMQPETAALWSALVLIAGAGFVIGVLSVTGLGFNLTLALVQLGAGSMVLLLVLAAGVCILLGMGLPTAGVYVLLAALVAPAMVKVGIEPMAAHMYVMYFGMMSMITPPIAIAAYAAAGIAGADPMRTGLEACRFGWSAYVVPFLFVFSPTLLLIGPADAVALAIVTASLGIWLVSIAVIGFFMRPVSGGLRLLFAASGLLALIPAGAFPGAAVTDAVGAAIGAALIAREVWIVRFKPQRAAA